MKANKVPEKIYLTKNLLGELRDGWDALPSENFTSIEYLRTDAFIEKACSWLKNHYRDYMHNPTGKRLEAFFGGDMCNDFENYIKGE